MAALTGFCGALVHVAVGMHRRENLSPSLIFATLLTGTILAATGSTVCVELAGMPPASGGGVSFLIGVVGMKVVVKVLDGDIVLPFLKGGNGK